MGSKGGERVLRNIHTGAVIHRIVWGLCPRDLGKWAPLGASRPMFGNPSLTCWSVSLPLPAQELVVLDREHWTLPAVALTLCLICPLATMLGGALSRDCLQHHSPCGGEGGLFLFARGRAHAAPSSHSSNLSPSFPGLLLTAFLFPSFFLHPSPILLCSLLSSSLLSPWNHYHRTKAWMLFKGTRVTLLCGPGSKPLANGADIRENKLWIFYWNFTAGSRYLHGGTKYTRVGTDTFHSKTAKMKSQLQIRFEMDLRVSRDCTVTNEFVPRWNTNLLCFSGNKED